MALLLFGEVAFGLGRVSAFHAVDLCHLAHLPQRPRIDRISAAPIVLDHDRDQPPQRSLDLGVVIAVDQRQQAGMG
jgi:hypothetical protein